MSDCPKGSQPLSQREAGWEGVMHIAKEIKTKAEIDVICSKAPASEKLLK